MAVTKKLYEKCEKCQYVADCDEKRMAVCGFLPLPEPLSATASEKMTNPVSNGMLVEHDFRDVKIGPNITITIDLENLKKNLELEFYRAIGCPAFQLGGGVG